MVKIGPAGSFKWAGRLRWFMVIVLALVGLVFIVTGGGLLRSQRWPRAAGTVGACTTEVVHTGTRNSSRTEQVCDVTWDAGGGPHTASISVDRTVGPGNVVDLRVNGDSAVVSTPPWLGAATTAGGLALLAFAAVTFVRARRSA